MLLCDVFHSPGLVENALELYKHHYLAKWSLSAKVLLYNYGMDAFDPSHSDGRAFQAFAQIYDTLWNYWKLSRGARANSDWNAEEALACLRGACSPWDMDSNLTLMTLDVSDNRKQLQQCFDAFAGIKRQSSGDYPWVAASKFLHFFNPRLFPIYDTAEVWAVALDGCFKHDYRSFCQRIGARPGECSSIFNCTYTALAADLMQNAHPDLMSQFAFWFRGHCAGCVDGHNVLKIDTYYATAFEMVLLGATKM